MPKFYLERQIVCSVTLKNSGTNRGILDGDLIIWIRTESQYITV